MQSLRLRGAGAKFHHNQHHPMRRTLKRELIKKKRISCSTMFIKFPATLMDNDIFLFQFPPVSAATRSLVLQTKRQRPALRQASAIYYFNF
jgi:hypothetical protein